MDTIKGFNDAVAYMEQHMADEINVNKAAQIADCSVYHFQRIFAYLANISLPEYIRKRRMSLAQTDIQNGEKILDVALKYGYESPTALNRAFKSVLGIAPSSLKKKGAMQKAFPPITFNIAVTGRFTLKKKLHLQLPEFRLNLTTILKKNFAVVPKMWMKAAIFGTIKKIAALRNNPQIPGILGVSIPCCHNSKWKYFIASATINTTHNKFESAQIGAFTWAVFPGKGTSRDIQILEKRIVLHRLDMSTIMDLT